MGFIILTTSDSGESFYVRAEQITAMYRHGSFTMVHYASISSSSCWAVKETPQEIFDKIRAGNRD